MLHLLHFRNEGRGHEGIKCLVRVTRPELKNVLCGYLICLKILLAVSQYLCTTISSVNSLADRVLELSFRSG
jgi:hypothetical protein